MLNKFIDIKNINEKIIKEIEIEKINFENKEIPIKSISYF